MSKLGIFKVKYFPIKMGKIPIQMFYEKSSHCFFKLVCISEKPKCGNYYEEMIQKTQ